MPTIPNPYLYNAKRRSRKARDAGSRRALGDDQVQPLDEEQAARRRQGDGTARGDDGRREEKS